LYKFEKRASSIIKLDDSVLKYACSYKYLAKINTILILNDYFIM